MTNRRERRSTQETIPFGFRPFVQLLQDLQSLAEKLSYDPNPEAFSRYFSALNSSSFWLNENANANNSIIREFIEFLQNNLSDFISQNLASSMVDSNNPDTVRFIHESDQLASLLAWIGEYEVARDTLLRVHLLKLSDKGITIALSESLLKAPFEDKIKQLNLLSELAYNLQNILEKKGGEDQGIDDLWSKIYLEIRRIELSLDTDVLLNPETDIESFHNRYKEFADRKAEVETLDNTDSEQLQELIIHYKELFSQIISDHRADHDQLIAIARKATEDIKLR